MKNYDLSKEQTVLGSLLSGDAKKVIPKVVKIFGNQGKNVFYGKNHPQIYQTIIDLHNRGDPIEILSVTSYLEKKFKIEALKSYLVDLLDQDLGPTAAQYHAVELKRLALARETQKLFLGATKTIKNDPEIELLTFIDKVQEKLTSLKKQSIEEKKSMTLLESLNTPTIENPSPIRGGFLVPGRYTIVAATDGEGKTTWCTQLALCAVTGTSFLGRFPIKKPIKVLYFCGENSRGDINEKFKKQISQLQSLLGREIKEDLKNIILVEPLKIDFLLDRKQDTPFLNSWLETSRPDIVIFDPLNNFVSDDESLSDDRIARKTSKTLNKLATEFNCFPILTTHFKKESEVKPANIFEMMHGSKYWTNPAACQIAMTRANQQKYPTAKKMYFNSKVVTEISPMLLLRDKNSLWYEEVSLNEISKAKLVPQDVVEVLKRKCEGKAVPSIFDEIAAKELGCSQRQIRDLIKLAKDKGLIVKEAGLIKIAEFRKRKQQELIPSKSNK